MTAPLSFNLPSPFAMKRGGQLHQGQLAYETWGELAKNKDNAILVLSGLSPSAHAASAAGNPAPGWWEEMIGPGKAIDTARWFVICPNSLGSCKGSTGPASINPATGKTYRLDFPELAIEDVAAATWELVAALGIKKLFAVVGPSMGGMTAQILALQQPQAVPNAILISTTPQALPFAVGIRSLQREAIRLDPVWKRGDYEPERPPLNGMRIARKLGVVTYRSAEEWKERFGRARIEHPVTEPFGREFQIEGYLENHAERFIHQFDANCYLYLSRAMDWFDLADYGETVEIAYTQMAIKRALVIGVDSDILFPVEQQEQIAEGLRAAGAAVEFHALPSIQGHDAFLVDYRRFCPLVSKFLQSL